MKIRSKTDKCKSVKAYVVFSVIHGELLCLNGICTPGCNVVITQMVLQLH